MEYKYQVGNEVKTVRVEVSGGGYQVTVGDRTYTVGVQDAAEGHIAFSVDGRHLKAYTAKDKADQYAAFDAVTYRVQKVNAGQRRKTVHAAENVLSAAMPGQVLKVLVADGDTVKRGQTLIIVEAMKMETRVTAHDDGQVVKVLCAAGEIVERGQRLIELR